jgi:hypothetical protein
VLPSVPIIQKHALRREWFPLIYFFALVQMWDARIQRSIRSIFGPFVCGNGLTVMNEQLVTASWRSQDSLQAWDIGSGRLLNTKAVCGSDGQALKLYSARYSPSTGLVAGGSSQRPGAQV